MPLGPGADPMAHPLIAQLFTRHGFTLVTAESFAAWTQRPGRTLLLFLDDPGRNKETLDIAVIVPQLAQAFPGRFAVGVLLPDAAREHAVRYGFRRWPAFVLLADAKYVGAVDGLRGWDDYRVELARLLDARQSPADRWNRGQGRALTAGDAMKDFPVSVRSIGAGSQPGDDDELQYLAMPREMNTFRMPRVPERAEDAALAASRDLLALLLSRLDRWDPAIAPHGPRLDLGGLSAAALQITDQMLGEGEVSIRIAGARAFRIQESVFTGLWRVCALDADGRLCADWLEAGTLPEAAAAAARNGGAVELARIDIPTGAMNSPALLTEIRSQIARPVAR